MMSSDIKMESESGWRSKAMITNEYVLELTNVFHSGQVETGTCMQKMIGTVRTGVILKDVSMELHGGELSAVLGSKGSGKHALLEVISRRAQGPTRGQILLNGVPMSMRLFQESCGYVTQKCDLLPGITVKETLEYSANLTVGSKVGSFVKHSRVKQVMADLALTNLANRNSESLSQSEYRRLVIGTQLVRDPVVLLLDEPTWDLDPLNTYFIVSILANHAKKYNRIVLLTMEKPRSDIFPFLDRVTYLCLGDVVYTGATRMMLDYFRSIGFPCPELENPLMYYLCLSTVDRRSRDRFIESNNQIASLVEKFKMEGGPYRKYGGPPPDAESVLDAASHQKVPLTAYGRPNSITIFYYLLMRSWCRISPFNIHGMQQFFIKILMMPTFFFLLWIFYYNSSSKGMENQYQRNFVTRNGLVFNSLAGAYFMSILATVTSFATDRTRYYQEVREGIYGGPLFLLSNLVQSLPLSALTTFMSTFIIFRGLKNELICYPDGDSNICKSYSSFDSDLDDLNYHLEYSYYPDLITHWLALWACYLLAEQQTVSILMVVKSSYTATLVSVFLTVLYLVLGSATVRSYSSLPKTFYHLTYLTQSRYTGLVLNDIEFFNKTSLQNLGLYDDINERVNPCKGSRLGFGCRYGNGTLFLTEKYGYKHDRLETIMDRWFNIGVSILFPAILFLLNNVLYLIPLPAFVKAKFRE
uniref:ATP-binding cassette sub-family G member 5 n=2 Tax=Lepeophtheirus salmonis TaxID=72036 RepID=A0A0K2T2T6_LEPSM